MMNMNQSNRKEDRLRAVQQTMAKLMMVHVSNEPSRNEGSKAVSPPLSMPSASSNSDADTTFVGTHIDIVGGRYRLLRTIGEGKFGKVKLAMDLITKQTVAIKLVMMGGSRYSSRDKYCKALISLMLKERQVMQILGSHPNIVQLHEFITEDFSSYVSDTSPIDFEKRSCFVMEAVDGEELFNMLIREKRFKEEKARRLFKQLLVALKHCHSNGVYHRDLKPENILVDKNENLKLIDFGLAAYTENASSCGVCLQRTACGSSSYAAPEVLQKTATGYDPEKADMWSAGVILFTLLTGNMLVYQTDDAGEEMSFNDFLRAATKIDYHDVVRKQVGSAAKSKTLNLSQPVLSLLLSLLKVDPSARPCVTKAMDHPWFNDGEKRRMPQPPVVSRVGVQIPVASKKREEFRNALLTMHPGRKFDIGGITATMSPRCSPVVDSPAHSPMAMAPVK